MLTKKKVSEMQIVGNINNFHVFGWDTSSGSARATMSQLRGNTGATPNITVKVNTIPYGTPPSVGKTGTAENPTLTIGFPLAKNGEKPLLRKLDGYIQYKYESDSVWVDWISLDELRFHFSDLTTAQIKVLQSPALEAAERLDLYLQEKDEEFAQLQQDVENTIQDTEAATKDASDAATNANKAIEKTEVATDAAKEAAIKATDAADKVNEAIAKAEVATDAANTAAKGAETATETAIDASDRLNALSDHRTKIIDGYWWEWNETMDEWENTGERANGDVLFATFYIKEGSKKLYMRTPNAYNGPTFKLVKNKLYVIINA